jgi:methanogenic corrinoid protein MtbC1
MMNEGRDNQGAAGGGHAAADDLEGRFTADLIRARGAELASLAAEAMIASQTAMAQRYSPDPQAKWRDHFLGRLTDLAAAINVDAPRIFGQQVAWARQAFLARGVPVTDLAASLKTLRAVLERELPGVDQGRVNACFRCADEAILAPETEAPSELSVTTAHGHLAAQYLLHILEGSRREAALTVTQAVKQGSVSLADAYLHVLIPVQREVGRMWHMNELSVAEEHFATATTRSVMAQLSAMAMAREPNGLTLIIAAAQGNTHDLGVRVVADFFEIAGWRVIELGADVPAADLARAAVDYSADLLAISAAMPSQISIVEDTIGAVREQLGTRCPAVLVGGPAFSSCPEAADRIGADGFASSPDEAIEMAHRLVKRAS